MTPDIDKKLVIGLLNPQGHVRWKNLQIAAHPDTGGQIVYIIELSKALEKLGFRIDLFTRYFSDPDWPGYDREIEEYSPNLRIVRIKCGPVEKFVKKEELWPIIHEFAAGIEKFYEEQGSKPDVFTGHYADGGLAAVILKKKMGIPFTFTGHSLGGKKMDNLNLSRANFAHVNSRYNFHLRVIAERLALRNASAVVTSTAQEVKKQYGHRVYIRAAGSKKKFNIIPPGIDPKNFFPYTLPERDAAAYENAVAKLMAGLSNSISRKRMHMPFIFSAARFAAKKNPNGLLKAYAKSETLRSRMNLLIVAGNVDDPLNDNNRHRFDDSKKHIIDEIKSAIAAYKLEGKVCFLPGFDHISELPFIYRYAARSRWVFINPALHEPFGLTIVEAMASGLPVIGTKHGGPLEIIQDDEYGVLIEPTDHYSISGGIKKMLRDKNWDRYSLKGMERVKEQYTWAAAAQGYGKLLSKVVRKGFSDKKDYPIPGYFMDPAGSDDREILKELRRRYYLMEE
ncbi:MAG: glycosyltransferase [Elusimicrobia bacterium]|nr:glycosyltransferase [Elusimicrobiota bacterium]